MCQLYNKKENYLYSEQQTELYVHNVWLYV